MGSRPENGDASAREILVVDDDEGFRGFLVDLLERNGHACVAAETGEQALAAAAARRPALVLLDVRLDGISGYEVCHQLRAAHGSRLAIVLMSGERTESFDSAAGFLLGADDYLTKPVTPEEVIACVAGTLRRSPAAAGRDRLTQREREVLGLLMEGLGQREIASSLFISTKTVGKHIERILEKLGVHSRTEAVAVAYRDGLASS